MSSADQMWAASESPTETVGENLRWYAIHTYPRHEKKVDRGLRGAGITSFLPLLTQAHRWSDRRQTVDVPLFPCYTFVQIQPVPEARVAVLKTPGVIGLVGKTGEGTAIPDGEVNRVRSVLAERLTCVPYPFLKRGQRVRIRGGSLDGVEGIWLGQKNGGTLIISVELIQQSIAVSVEGYDVEAA